MRREIVPFIDEQSWLAERAKDLTSTDCAALFSCSPYLTRFELWHRKVGGFVAPHPENDRQSWGKRLQDSIAAGVAMDEAFVLRRMEEYIRLPDLRIGSSFDFAGEHYDDTNGTFGADLVPKICKINPEFLVEVKNVDSLVFRQGWTETEFGIEAPVHIELQAQHQLLVSGLAVCYIAALVGGNRVHLLRREADEPTHARILEEAAKFWAGGEPEPDFFRDASFIAQLYARSDGTVATADDEIEALFREYAGYKATASIAQDNADAVKANILTRIGAASKVLGQGYTLHCEERDAVEVAAHTRRGFRNFRLYTKGEKKS